MERIIKFFVFPAALVGTSGFAVALWQSIPSALTQWQSHWPFPAGIILYLLLWRFVFSRRAPFWSIVEHELTHAVFALLCFKRVRALNAYRKRGGRVVVEGGNFVIALAPYVFPLPILFLILAKWMIVPQYNALLNFFLGFFLMFHLIPLFYEYHPSQPDIRGTGILFSTIIILFGNLFFVGLTLAALEPGAVHIPRYLKTGWEVSLHNAHWLSQWIWQQLMTR